MTFLVLLIALLVERFFDFSHLRHWFWVQSITRFVKERLKTASPWALFAANVLPLVLVLMLVNVVLVKSLYGFPGLVFDVVVLLYCFGPRNFWADAFACINALVTNPEAAVETCRHAFGVSASLDANERYRDLLKQLFLSSLGRVFGVVFWYAVLGVGGALLYRLVVLLRDNAESATEASTTHLVLDWLPVRVLTLIFALAGHFSKVLAIWPKKAVLGLASSDALLVDCGFAAIDAETVEMQKDGHLLHAAVSLMDRSFILALVILLVGGLIL